MSSVLVQQFLHAINEKHKYGSFVVAHSCHANYVHNSVKLNEYDIHDEETMTGKFYMYMLWTSQSKRIGVREKIRASTP